MEDNSIKPEELLSFRAVGCELKECGHLTARSSNTTRQREPPRKARQPLTWKRTRTKEQQDEGDGRRKDLLEPPFDRVNKKRACDLSENGDLINHSSQSTSLKISDEAVSHVMPSTPSPWSDVRREAWVGLVSTPSITTCIADD